MTTQLATSCGHPCADAVPPACAEECCLCWLASRPSFATSADTTICEPCILRYMDTIPDAVLDHPPILALRDAPTDWAEGAWSCKRFSEFKAACEAEVAARSLLEDGIAMIEKVSRPEYSPAYKLAKKAARSVADDKPSLRSRIVTASLLTLAVAGWVLAGAMAGSERWLLAAMFGVGSLGFLVAWSRRSNGR